MADDSAAHKGVEFIQEVWGLAGVSIFVSALRLYQRISTTGFKGLTLDDYLMIFTTGVVTFEYYLGWTVVAYWRGFANNAMTAEQRATLSPDSEEYYLRVWGSKTHVVGLITYTTVLWLLKGCWAFYYSRLTAGVQDRRNWIRWSAVVIPASYIACILVACLKCVPFDHQWQINPEPPLNCQPAISPLQTIFVMVMNTVTDFYLMAIPLPMIWKSSLPLKKKIAILMLFSGALLEMAFGILRCVSILTVGNIDPSQAGYWSIRESFVSMTLTNLPMIYALFCGWYNKLRGKPDLSEASSGGSYPLSSYPRDHVGGSRNPRPVPGHTVFDSKEHINVKEDHHAESDVDERSLDLPKQLCSVRNLSANGWVVETGRRAASSSVERNGSLDQLNQILVTTEYTVYNEEDIKRAG